MMVDAVALSHTPAAPRPLSRTLHQWGLLLGVIGAVLGFLLGYFLGGLGFADTNSNGSNIQILLAYSLGAVGFLAGMGFFNRLIGSLLGRRAPTLSDEAFLNGEGVGLSRYFRMTVDHKVI